MKKSPLRRSSKPIPRQSKKTKKLYEEVYLPLRERLLAEHPWCQRCMQMYYAERDMVKVARIYTLVKFEGGQRSVDIHHKQGRIGENMTDESQMVALCRECHSWCHDHPKESEEQGWLISNKIKFGEQP